MNDQQHPARRLRHGERPTEPLVFDDEPTPAATSGDAPTDLQQLKARALAVESLPDTIQPYVSRGTQVVVATHSLTGVQLDEVAGFYDAASPAVVLDLIARIKKLHAGWSEAFNVARGWEEECKQLRAAVSAATKLTADLPKTWQERIKRFGNLPIGTVTATQNDCMREEIAELRSLLATKTAAAPIDEQQDSDHVMPPTRGTEGQHAANSAADDQWIFDLAAEHEANRSGLYGPVTFDAVGLGDFAHAIETVVASRFGAQGRNTQANNDASSKSDAVIEAREQALIDAGRAAGDQIVRVVGACSESYNEGVRDAVSAIAELRTQAAGAEGAAS